MQQQSKDQLRKQGRVYDLTTQSPRKPPKAPKAVDEDLYKIPPEILYQKPKRVCFLLNFSLFNFLTPFPCKLSFIARLVFLCV